MLFPYYEIILPLPPSVNDMYQVGGGVFCRKTKKTMRVQTKSAAYKEWEDRAGTAWRNHFPHGASFLTGRLRADYIFIWHDKDPGRFSSDVSNREKCASDFLEKKLYENDNMIDEQHHFRRISAVGQNRLWARIYAIPDRRHDDPALIFNPVPKTERNPL